MIKRKNQLYRKYKAFPFNPKVKQRYQKYRNLPSKLIREAKAKFYSIKITEAINNPKKAWEIINMAFYRKTVNNEIPDGTN